MQFKEKNSYLWKWKTKKRLDICRRHADALLKIIEEAKINSCYNIGARNILTNLDLVKTIANIR